jgi:hypothetical protein
VVFYPTSAPAPLCITLSFGGSGGKNVRLHLQAKVAGIPQLWLNEIKTIKLAKRPLAPLSSDQELELDALRNGRFLSTSVVVATINVQNDEKKPMVPDGSALAQAPIVGVVPAPAPAPVAAISSGTVVAEAAAPDKEHKVVPSDPRNEKALRVLDAPATVQARAHLIHDIRLAIRSDIPFAHFLYLLKVWVTIVK